MDNNMLMHYGVARRSGRYPWGSGGELISSIEKLQKKGLTEVEIAAGLGLQSTEELRNQKALATSALKEAQRLNVIRQRDGGMSVAAISREFKIPASTVRDLLKLNANMKYRIIKDISDYLRKLIGKDKFVDVGDGSEIYMGISRTKLKNVITLLKNEGYPVYKLRQEQLGAPGRMTTIMVLGSPDSTFKDLLAKKAEIQIPHFKINDTGEMSFLPDNINNLSSKRVLVKYATDGGSEKDGLIEMRAGVPEFNLGSKRYAQVRIGVDGTHFMKGMAVMRDDLPKGVDIVYNTSSLPTGNKLDAMKKQVGEGASKVGSVVTSNTYIDKNGKEQFGVLNIVGGGEKQHIEGAWSNWNKSLASQVLSKQAPRIAEKQLSIKFENSKAELDDILKLTNPTVRNHLLMEFGDGADRNGVELKAAAMPRQTTNVILPDPTMKPKEIYAPNYNNGDVVSLVRYPHGGVFEVPTLTVNNKASEFRHIIGTTAPDAVAIHPSVATKLSGADFDGDTVLVIPNKNKVLRTEKTLDSLRNFEPKVAYKKVPGMKVMSEKQKQRQMGNISNLITDMTIKGASNSEIASAVRHSMVVIDAAKHELNYKQSAIDNRISSLKTKYQGSARAGAATLISRTKSEYRVLERHDNYGINPKTGEKVFTYTGKKYKDRKTGELIDKTISSTKGYEKDPSELSSKTVIETVYVKHAKRMRALGNEARLATLTQEPTPYSRTARATYKTEVAALDKKYKAAVASRPIERKAQLIGGEIYRAKLNANPDMSRADIGKQKGAAIALARTRIKGSKPVIEITPREWHAIELGAVSPTRLKAILRNADMDAVRKHATPRAAKAALTGGKKTRARSLIKGGYTAAEIALALGVPVSQVQDLD